MSNDLDDFKQFMKRREQAARAYVRGDAAPLGQVVAHEFEATFFGPAGGYEQGADRVFARYERDATSFQPGGDSHFEILQLAASAGVAYWVGFQHASAHFAGSPQAIPMKLRVTELFRREGDEWKLVHRHADALAAEEKQAAK
jgi:ketosteroid isomerase-like protein